MMYARMRHMTTHARACSVGERQNKRWQCTDFFSEKRCGVQGVIPLLFGWFLKVTSLHVLVFATLSMCGASSLSMKELERANDHVSCVLCPGDGESAKLTPRAHYNDYTAKERAEIGKYGSRVCGNTIRKLPKIKIAKLYT